MVFYKILQILQMPGEYSDAVEEVWGDGVRVKLLPKIITKPAKFALDKIKKNPVKAVVVASSGDIPKTAENIKKTLENWREQGSKIQSTPRVSNLGKFRDWSSLSTQSF
jgi:hypothetical protein